MACVLRQMQVASPRGLLCCLPLRLPFTPCFRRHRPLFSPVLSCPSVADLFASLDQPLVLVSFRPFAPPRHASVLHAQGVGKVVRLGQGVGSGAVNGTFASGAALRTALSRRSTTAACRSRHHICREKVPFAAASKGAGTRTRLCRSLPSCLCRSSLLPPLSCLARRVSLGRLCFELSPRQRVPMCTHIRCVSLRDKGPAKPGFPAKRALLAAQSKSPPNEGPQPNNHRSRQDDRPTTRREENNDQRSSVDPDLSGPLLLCSFGARCFLLPRGLLSLWSMGCLGCLFWSRWRVFVGSSCLSGFVCWVGFWALSGSFRLVVLGSSRFWGVAPSLGVGSTAEWVFPSCSRGVGDSSGAWGRC